jgi:8-oxo-dGTP pyrophosphatase MutT (NUDIX family)
MLVTSRDTKRWVLPKGNLIPGLSPHAAAAHEAEEEAGVRGLACPTPLGAYRYRKTRKSGASLMVDVDVFPILVTREMDEWEEQALRERRWFSLAEAAQVVAEPDLQLLIRQFRASEANNQGNERDVRMVSAVVAATEQFFRPVRSARADAGCRR